MPAHIGIGDRLRLGAQFVVANISLDEKFRYARELAGGPIKMKKLKQSMEMKREQRETDCGSYMQFRERLDGYDPNKVVPRNVINRKTCDQAEWDLYLRPGTAFDITCRRYYEVFRGMNIMLITHKSDRNKLKRIEGHPPGEKMRVLWSEAA